MAICKFVNEINDSNFSDFDDDDAIFKSVGLGLNFGAGILLNNNVSMTITYMLGLSNVNPAIDLDTVSVEGDDISTVNRGFRFSLAYYLNNK